jgi:hypothetical protein
MIRRLELRQLTFCLKDIANARIVLNNKVPQAKTFLVVLLFVTTLLHTFVITAGSYESQNNAIKDGTVETEGSLLTPTGFTHSVCWWISLRAPPPQIKPKNLSPAKDFTR